ncbi:MAG: hypothetical protein U9N52_04825 [Campylobacterota bacterium]|nr:hypothetical protein [Campylobacterota bacterium]
MALKSLGEQYEEVQNAISSVMSGQSYDIAGRKMTKANLAELTGREKFLLERIEKYGFDFIPSSAKTQKAALNVQFS